MKTFLVLILLLMANVAHATKSIHYYKRIGKVEIRIITLSTSLDNIEEAIRIGRMCNKYLKSINSGVNTLFLDFIYSSKDSMKCFMGFNKARESFICYGEGKEYDILKKEGLVLHLIASKFSENSIIPLIRYGLNNIEPIKQKQRVLNNGCFQWEGIEYSQLTSWFGRVHTQFALAYQ